MKSSFPAQKNGFILHNGNPCRHETDTLAHFFCCAFKDLYFPSLQDCKNSWWADGEFDFHAPGNVKNAAKILRKGLKRDNVSGVIKSLYSTILRDKMEITDFVQTKGCSAVSIQLYMCRHFELRWPDRSEPRYVTLLLPDAVFLYGFMLPW